MCTVICRWDPDAVAPVRILAIRDELISRDFDEPADWWPEQPEVIGGRDRKAGGTWCASGVSSGVTAVVLNRPDRMIADPGAPSRGVLPLLGVAHGHDWTGHIDVAGMASFNLVIAAPGRLTWWSYDGVALFGEDLAPGTHHFTPRGLVADSPWSDRPPSSDGTDPDADLSGPLDALWGRWRQEVTGAVPSGDPGAMIVRRDVETPAGPDVYGTVFGQFIAARPGRLRIDHARDPYREQEWSTHWWESSPHEG